jgi:D-beta-D-heptose 7-phosphate kinase/D-beta-D-heptose 1-phosphate adenosyltransferase
MDNNLSRLIEQFAGLNVLVIGEAMLDSYLAGEAGALCREAPVPIVRLSSRADAPGAANTAANVRSLGGHVALLSVVGGDHERDLLWRALEERGVCTDHLLTWPSRRTLAKHRVVAASQILVRFDQGSTDPVDPRAEQMLLDRLVELFPRSDAVIISDYGYGILTPRVVKLLADLQSRAPRIVVADAKRLATYRDVGVIAVKPNYAEAVQLLGGRLAEVASARAAEIAALGGRLLDITGAQIAAVTLDADGALVVERGGPAYRTYARPTRHSYTAGAGDTFLSALALALAAGADTPAAAGPRSVA